MPIDARPLLRKCPVIPVLTIDDPALGVDLAKALVAGGLDVIEITLRTPNALAALEAIVTAVPKATVGAGTITRLDDISRAMAAGAEFLVSPGTTADLAAAFAAAPIPVLPGCATASEAMALRDRGFSALKFFPAEPAGGVAALKALAGPLPDLVFCPTGGIDPSKAPAYLALGHVGAVGGSWLAPGPALAARDWALVERLAREARALRP